MNMINRILKLIRALCSFMLQTKKIEEVELFLGDTGNKLFGGNQKLLTRYDDFVEIGTWGTLELNEDGTIKDGSQVTGGKMYSQTVKYIGNDGIIKLGTDWVDNNIQI